MSETKWTPGPWSVVEADKSGVWNIRAKQGSLHVLPATAYGLDDAHLIAAGPELYEGYAEAILAVDAALMMVEVGGPENIPNWDWLRQVRAEGRAALAKARGDHTP